ncbi:MAG: hypothetical protein KatS3mg102_1532 [Planctomycetota bacterium]|nr:MAG: hypothetical protein KatS3mg102_1532 [Planctomycetota bacterium]
MLLAESLPDAASWAALRAALGGRGVPGGPAQYAWRRCEALAGRALRLEALLAIEPTAALAPQAALRLARLCLARALLESRREPARPELVQGLERLLGAAGVGRAALQDELAALRAWAAAQRGRAAAADAGPCEQHRHAHYLQALQQLAARLRVLGPAAEAVHARLRWPAEGAGYAARLIACWDPPLPASERAVLLPGLLVRAHLEQLARPEPVRLAALGELAAAVEQARRVVEGREYEAPWHFALALEQPQPASAPAPQAVPRPAAPLPLEGGSGALAVLAAFHLAAGCRHPLPPTVGFTGRLQDGKVLPVGRAADKAELAIAAGMRVLFVPDGNGPELERWRAEHPERARGLVLESVPATLGGAALLDHLEQRLAAHYPGVLDYPPERLHFFLERALGRVQAGGRAEPRAEFHFLLRVTEARLANRADPAAGAGAAAGTPGLLARNVHAVALAGIGWSHAHEGDAGRALQFLRRAGCELAQLLRERALLPVALGSWLELDNYLAVALIDLLRLEQAERLLRRSLRRKERAGAFCAAPLLAASHGSLGQVLTYRAALVPELFAAAEAHLQRALRLAEPAQRERDRVYLATARLRAGRTAEALALLEQALADCSTRPDREAQATARYARLRAVEACARAADPQLVAGGWELLARARELSLEPWQQAVLDKWEAVLLARQGQAGERAQELFDRAVAALQRSAAGGELHGDLPLAAGAELERALVLEKAGARARAAAALLRACALLAPFARTAPRGAVRTLRALLARLRAAMRRGQRCAAAARALAGALPY